MSNVVFTIFLFSAKVALRLKKVFMAFIKVQDHKKFGSYVISVSPNSQSINFGADFIRENGLEKAKYVCLYLDYVDFLRIGFSFHDHKVDKDCIKLNEYKQSDSKIIIARKFFNRQLSEFINDWRLYRKRKYTPGKEKNTEFGTVYFIKLQRNDFNKQEYSLDYDEIEDEDDHPIPF